VIEVEHRDEVAIVRLADGKANTMTVELCSELTARFEEIRLSPAQAVVLTGTGRIFSAGVDLLRLLEGGRSYIRAFLPELGSMFATVFSHPKPVVAAVNGHAIAGGCVLACAADRRLMARAVGRIGVTELLVGVAFPAVAMEIMRCVTAPQYFEEAIFGGEVFTPADALARGLVNELVEPGELLDRAVDTARALASLPPSVFALTKRQTRDPAFERIDRVGPTVDAAVEEIWTAPETLERIRAYVANTLGK
jgi:enoyl-CoA hydratase